MKIKRLLLILFGLFFLTGCVRLDNLSYDDILNNFNLKAKNSNVFRKGYKFYLPTGLSVEEAGDYYAIISKDSYKYYVFFDLVSFNEQKEITYDSNSNAVYSKLFEKDNNKGYINIKIQNEDKYLIEIMYNYAKIEVMVDKDKVNESLINTVDILNSIVYNKEAIKSLLENNDTSYKEEIFDMFEKVKEKSGFLNYSDDSEDDTNEEEIKDTDFMN